MFVNYKHNIYKTYALSQTFKAGNWRIFIPQLYSAWPSEGIFQLVLDPTTEGLLSWWSVSNGRRCRLISYAERGMRCINNDRQISGGHEMHTDCFSLFAASQSHHVL